MSRSTETLTVRIPRHEAVLVRKLALASGRPVTRVISDALTTDLDATLAVGAEHRERSVR